MPTNKNRITVPRGNDLTITRTIVNVPSGQVLAKAWFTVKRYISDPDSSAVIQKIITAVLTAAGHITDTGSDGTGAVDFFILHTETDLLVEDVDYVYDVKVFTSGGKYYTPEIGTFVASGSVTDAKDA
jgi:hypothetical protein